MTFIAYHQPEERAAYQREISRKLAVLAGLSPEGPSEFIVRKAAAIEKPVKAHVAHVTRSSNNNYNNERVEQGRKLCIVAGIL